MKQVVHQAREKYGENFHPHLLEQYKAYRDRIVDIINDRNTQNKYLFAVLTAILAIPAFLLKSKVFGEGFSLNLAIASFLFPVIGMLLSYWWVQWNKTFKQAIGAGYRVLVEMEQHLPAQPFTVEPEHRIELGGGTHRQTSDFTIRIAQMFFAINAVLAVAILARACVAS